MYLRAIGAIVLLILSASSVTARGPYGSVKIGNWSGGAFTNDQTGAFTGCVASAPYKSGITVFVMVSSNVTWNLGFLHNGWSLKPGSTFPIVLTFDGRSPFNVDGRVISAHSVSVDMPDTSDLIKQFRASTTMSAFAQGNLFQFNLRITRRADLRRDREPRRHRQCRTRPAASRPWPRAAGPRKPAQ
jgi:hypothetical protein